MHSLVPWMPELIQIHVHMSYDGIVLDTPYVQEHGPYVAALLSLTRIYDVSKNQHIETAAFTSSFL